MYFLRLALLKQDIEKIAGEAWDDFEVIMFCTSRIVGKNADVHCEAGWRKDDSGRKGA